MANEETQDFGRLYRRAYAETNPQTKSILLAQVQRAIDNWEQANQQWSVSARPRGIRSMDDAGSQSA
jgi:hypothetical protein